MLIVPTGSPHHRVVYALMTRRQQEARMDRKDETDNAPASNDVLGWAGVAGLIHIYPDGSWTLSELGKAKILELEQGSDSVKRALRQG
jgi:hypothetical protein